MHYVVQVVGGQERPTRALCERILAPNSYQRCYLPLCEKMKKCQGQWRKTQEILFPGYLFFETSEIDALAAELKKIPRFTKLLGSGEFQPLSPDDIMMIDHLTGKERVLTVSIGYIIDDVITVIDGPLAGFEGSIKKIDRHKRAALVDLTFCGRTIRAKVGLEIVKKASTAEKPREAASADRGRCL
ncbi:MAG: antiterminator LoaP [Raoultibacter sp.]